MILEWMFSDLNCDVLKDPDCTMLAVIDSHSKVDVDAE